jgi:NTE family protein
MFGWRRRINLALQGGGAHGAFTWGVLDHLLDDGSFDIGWLSGTSAGAVNAVALADGLLRDGPEGARASLKRVWDGVEAAGVASLAWLNPFLYGMTKATTLTGMGGLLSPYGFNPLNIDPLRQLLNETIDFERIRSSNGPELIIAATDVGTGLARIFRRSELSVDAVLASACLPHVHHAVEIDGRAYWDGGFSANPDLITLASESPSRDTLLVQLNPLDIGAVPRSARDISGHVNTVTFNQPLLRDIAVLALAQDERSGGSLLRRRGRLERLARHRLHVIDAGPHTVGLGAQSKALPERSVLTFLFTVGRKEASRWLARHKGDIGRRQTVDLRARYLTGSTLPLSSRQTASEDVDETEKSAPLL